MASFLELTDDFLAGLDAARRSPNTLAGYRNDLVGIGQRIAEQLHNSPHGLGDLDVVELNQRVMRRAFGSWASDHSEGSLLRAWSVWNRFFTFLVDDEVLQRNPMKRVPKPRLRRRRPGRFGTRIQLGLCCAPLPRWTRAQRRPSDGPSAMSRSWRCSR